MDLYVVRVLCLVSVPVFILLFFFFSSSGDHRDLHSSLHDALPISIRVASCTTWLFVRMKPSGVNTNPEPCPGTSRDRKSTRLNSSHGSISYAVFCLKKKKKEKRKRRRRRTREKRTTRTRV